ncbi:MAG TPA: DNA polymerase III subunit gamma/tau [Longilinea sp.]|nr:DNA polymerase III subunit gamma/tau [Longilinea sp.]
MTKALYNKWRPQKWDEVVGQQHIIQTLRNAVVGGRVAHAYLFAGPRGTGKTTAARLLAKAVNCLEPDPAKRPCNSCAHCVAVNEGRFLDLIEIDAASNTSVEDVRDLRDKINFSPNQGQFKVYIIDEVHMLSTAAFNALLKTLEEPPAHAIFILATTEIHKIPATVLSRCQRHEFRRVPVDDITGQLKHIAEAEGLKAEPEALTLIARQSAGGMRDAISLLDQMASTGKEITLDLTQSVLGTATSQTVLGLVSAVLKHDPAAGMDAIHTALDAGSDPRLLARQVVDYLRALLLIQMGNASQVDLPADTRAQAEKHARVLSQAGVVQMIKSFNAAATDLRGGWQPALPLELALAEVMEQGQGNTGAGDRGQGQADGMSAIGRAADKPTAKEIERPSASPANRPVVSAAQTPAQKPAASQPEKAASAPVKAAETSVEETGTVSLEQVTKAWKQIRAQIKPQSLSLDGLLNSCRLLEVRDGVLVIGFASEVLRSKADTPEMKEIASKAIAEVCGIDLAIKCVVTNAKKVPPPNVKADGMVAAALKHGGEIVETQE